MRTLYIGVCAAGAADRVGELVALAQAADWDCWAMISPAACGMVDTVALADATGHPVRSAHRALGEPRSARPPADALIIAPASANTIGKLAAGISDTYLLDVASEAIGAGTPTVIVPFVNTAMAARRPFAAAVAGLRAEGVTVLLGGDGFVPHPPGTGGERAETFPWAAALTALTARLGER